MAAEPQESRNGVQVIARAAAVLRALEQNPDGLTLGEAAKIVELPRSTVQRIVDALALEGLVMSAGSAGGLRLGPAILSLASATRFELADVARDILRDLSRRSGETVDLSIIDQNKVVFIDQITGSHRLRAVSAVGVTFPLHCCAPGKAMLAALDDDELERVRRRLRLHAVTRNTITSWEALDDALERVRETGMAEDREENSIGICAASVALKGPSGELAAVSMPVPTHRYLENEQKYKDLLLASARRLQTLLARTKIG
ncbi:IclR family transcriptional regulator [Pararobbsia silviterrae]|uniref:IclR family transcriptional regulator n=1 Tax=Pararobbsia silviterrae TaxID=1792498 RepID=A0A494YDK9_9BURK|nr:IclR family transcriptional regulator [Pararobbsia silviterrae]RKP58423.1 IclR family transcriptional regulator [Pararobbsia silviterrae]